MYLIVRKVKIRLGNACTKSYRKCRFTRETACAKSSRIGSEDSLGKRGVPSH